MKQQIVVTVRTEDRDKITEAILDGLWKDFDVKIRVNDGLPIGQMEVMTKESPSFFSRGKHEDD